MKKKLFCLCPVLAAFLLELLPFGAVLRFADPEGEAIRRTYSYFDLTPYGYANFGPFLTALLTCLILAVGVIALFRGGRKLRTAMAVLSAVAFVTSWMPLLFGFDFLSAVGIGISLLLGVEFALCITNRNV